MFAETERKFARTGANVLTISEILGRPKISFYTSYMFLGRHSLGEGGYTAQQTSVHSVCSVVKNDAAGKVGKWYNAGAEERKEVAIVMKFKIVSGGQTGVDRAGLEAAIALGLPYGGWVPKGRLAEDGVVPLKYVGMQEHISSNYAVRTKANVRDSDAALIIAPGLPLSRGTMLTLRTAERLRRPHHVACLGDANAMDEAARWLQSFQRIERPFVLNIAGPRESGAPGIQKQATEFLHQLLSRHLV